jgi:hypothetical protein
MLEQRDVLFVTGLEYEMHGGLVLQPMSLRTCRDSHPRAECAKRTGVMAMAMARMSDKAIGDAGRVEHSEIHGLEY